LARTPGFLEEFKLFNPHQHGFHQSWSTLSQLVEHTEQVLQSLKDGGILNVVYLNFAKAFNKVDLGIFMTSLRNLGIYKNVGVW
jgi:ribonucleases P/MRP protein subunit RPP40